MVYLSKKIAIFFFWFSVEPQLSTFLVISLFEQVGIFKPKQKSYKLNFKLIGRTSSNVIFIINQNQ